MSISYEIGYQLPNGRWYTKNCENGAEYVCKLLGRGINEFYIRVWSRAETIEMSRYERDGQHTLQVNKTRNYYHTKMGHVAEYKINGCHLIRVERKYIPKSC